MSNIPEIFESIIHGELRPWLDSNKPDMKFVPMLSSLKIVNSAFPMICEIDFIRPFNNKTKYYSKLILNETNSYCNRIVELINDDENEKLMKYWLNDTLNKRLKTRIKEVGKLIQQNDYSLIYINPHKLTFDKDADHKTDTYVFQLLKVAFIKTYLEIQEVFKSLINDDLLIEDDFYTQLLNETIPEKSYLKKIPIINYDNTINQARPIVVEEEICKFSPIKGDFKKGFKGKLTYDDILKKEQFAEFEMKLFEYRYIDENYNFTNTHNKKKELAAIYHILIQKKYFRDKNYKYQRGFSPAHYRQYLDFRYNLDSAQQFRKLEQEFCSAIIDKYFWLNKL